MRRTGSARADLEALWGAIFRLYASRPAIGTAGTEVVGLALAAEDAAGMDPDGALRAIGRAEELLEDLGEPAA